MMNEELEQLKAENQKLKNTNQLLIHVLYLLRDALASPDQNTKNSAIQKLSKIIED